MNFELKTVLSRLNLFVLALCFLAIHMPLRAQIPADVKPILEKVEAWFDDADGLDVKMTGKVMTLKMTFHSQTKGDKALMTMGISLMGKSVNTMMGTDGKQAWTWDETTRTLTIEKESDITKDDNNVDFGLVKEYKKAKMKQTETSYELTLTEPRTKDSPAKMVLTVRKSDCRPTQMVMGSGLKKMSLTIESIKKGVPDDVFVLDMSKFPNAQVVRK